VLRQSVDPGAKVEKGTDVTLRLSAGLPLRAVPAVTGKSLADAQAALEGEGLEVRVRHAFSDIVHKGLIVEQNPSAEQQIPYGSDVILTVSDGRQPVDVPNVVGQSSGDAQSILVARKLNPTLEQEYSTTVPEGDVIRQDPAGGGVVPIGSKVTLVISLGPRTFAMPYVIGLSESDAKAQLEALGLEVEVVTIPGSVGDTVVGQSPGRGIESKQGDTARIYIGL
jgi:serine/threonine-protein kinase